MSEAWTFIAGNEAQKILLIADHASNHVPLDIDLGIDPVLLDTHIALDIGVAGMAAALCQRLNIPGILGGVSRLVVDLNREIDAPHIIPTASDGHALPGNAISHQERVARIARFWQPYHDEIARVILRMQPLLLVSLHSFTPRLATQPEEDRPWEVGILYNNDDRAARIAIPALEGCGVIVGDQLPYSGKILNATMNTHGEGNGIAYLGLEMRQDLIADAEGIAHWLDVIAAVVQSCANRVED
ncbi:N-formylglutamate amidohydrolase [Aquisediminimonas profunda]|uniref:N-formylglutamate amidohydrolase n=1 Tax=Aquisediminimonas profunda TaxID=1550733 RepID=UPI001C625A89|nr:N-formylglutamate amidohydrolase [Aquisediminimonas profunda]